MKHIDESRLETDLARETCRDHRLKHNVASQAMRANATELR